MRGIWQLAIAGGVVVGVLLVVTGFLLFEHGGKSSSSPTSQSLRTSTNSFGNADISAAAPAKPKAKGGPYQRVVVVRPKDRRSGVPIHGARVTIQGEMTSPHYMGPLYKKKLPEVARGEYEGPYTLVMAGTWRFVIVVRTKKGDTSTRSLPVLVID